MLETRELSQTELSPVATVGAGTYAARVRDVLHSRCRAGIIVVAYAAALVILWAMTVWRLRNFYTLTSSAAGSVAFALAFLVPFICFAFVLCGSWKSLAREKRGSGVLVANLAALGQVALLLTAAPTLMWSTFDIPKSFRAILYARDLLRGPEWSVIVDGPNRLHVMGPISEGLSASISRALATNHAIRIVVLESPGGDVEEAMQIAETIRRNQLSTGVSRKCSSACTIIFSAGTERILLSSGKLGFHGCRDALAYFPCRNSEEEDILVKYGVDRGFVHKALSIAPDKLWFPDSTELLAAHVITSTALAQDKGRSKTII